MGFFSIFKKHESCRDVLCMSEVKAEMLYRVLSALFSYSERMNCDVHVMLAPGNMDGSTTYYNYEGLNVHVLDDLIGDCWDLGVYFEEIADYLPLFSDFHEEGPGCAHKFMHISLLEGENDLKGYIDYLRGCVARSFPSVKVSVLSDGRQLSLVERFD